MLYHNTMRFLNGLSAVRLAFAFCLSFALWGGTGIEAVQAQGAFASAGAMGQNFGAVPGNVPSRAPSGGYGSDQTLVEVGGEAQAGDLLGCAGLNFDALLNSVLDVGNITDALANHLKTSAAQYALTLAYSSPIVSAVADGLNAMASARAGMLQARCDVNAAQRAALDLCVQRKMEKDGASREDAEVMCNSDSESLADAAQETIENYGFGRNLHEALAGRGSLCPAGNPFATTVNGTNCGLLAFVPNVTWCGGGQTCGEGQPGLNQQEAALTMAQTFETARTNVTKLTGARAAVTQACIDAGGARVCEALAVENEAEQAKQDAETPPDEPDHVPPEEQTIQDEFKSFLACSEAEPESWKEYVAYLKEQLGERFSSALGSDDFSDFERRVNEEETFIGTDDYWAALGMSNIMPQTRELMSIAVNCTMNHNLRLSRSDYVMLDDSLTTTEELAFMRAYEMQVGHTATTQMMHFLVSKITDLMNADPSSTADSGMREIICREMRTQTNPDDSEDTREESVCLPSAMADWLTIYVARLQNSIDSLEQRMKAEGDLANALNKALDLPARRREQVLRNLRGPGTGS